MVIHAKDCACYRCSRPANLFIGLADPDCKQRPYCAECGKEYRLEFDAILMGDEEIFKQLNKTHLKNSEKRREEYVHSKKES